MAGGGLEPDVSSTNCRHLFVDANVKRRIVVHRRSLVKGVLHTRHTCMHLDQAPPTFVRSTLLGSSPTFVTSACLVKASTTRVHTESTQHIVVLLFVCIVSDGNAYLRFSGVRHGDGNLHRRHDHGRRDGHQSGRHRRGRRESRDCDNRRRGQLGKVHGG